MNDIDCNLLEYIKDGWAMCGKLNTKKIRFTTPNVIIVFSNKYPDNRGFSEDRWMIFKINTKMELKEVTDSCRVKKKKFKKMVKESEDTDDGGGLTDDDW